MAYYGEEGNGSKTKYDWPLIFALALSLFFTYLLLK